MAMYIWVNIGSDNMHQTITLTNFELSSVSSLGIYQRAVSGNANIAHWNVFEMLHVWNYSYRKTSNIRRTLVGNNIVDHSDAVGASPVGAAPPTSSFST